MANLLYSRNDGLGVNNESFFEANRSASIAFIVIIAVYAVVRFCFNRVGGLYMFKKLLIAVILAGAVYDKPGFLGYLLGLELLFTILRYVIERPRSLC